MSSLTEARRQPLDWVGLGLLAALVAANALSLILLRTGGPLIGLALYAVLVWRWARRDRRSSVVGGLAGIAVHVLEVTLSGWSAYPDLMVVNLVLPGLLVVVGWLAGRNEEQQDRRRRRRVM